MKEELIITFTPEENAPTDTTDELINIMQDIFDGLVSLAHRPDKLHHIKQTIDYLADGELDGTISGRAKA